MPASHRRQRAPGAGRKRLTALDVSLSEDLKRLMGFPVLSQREPALVWTCKSATQLAAELRHMGHSVSQRSVHGLLADMKFELRSVGRSSKRSLDREAQFQFASRMVESYQAAGRPVVSLRIREGDHTKCNSAEPPAGTRASNNSSARFDSDFVRLSIELLRTWWRASGCKRCAATSDLLVIVDTREGIGRLARHWRSELQRLANECDFTITVCQLPPGTHRWRHKELALKCQINVGSGVGRLMLVELWLLSAFPMTTHALDKRLRAPKGLPIWWNYEVAPLCGPGL